LKVAICSPENILFLRYCTLNIPTARHKGVGHVEYSKARAMLLREPEGSLTPIAAKYLHDLP